MQNNRLKTWLLIVNLALFALNFTPALAQVMEIEVIGAGYRLIGPDTIAFPSISASLENQLSVRDIRDLNPQNEEEPSATDPDDFILIEDQNGSNVFNVTVSASDFTGARPSETIAASNLEIKNRNGAGADIVPGNDYSGLDGVSLHADTSDFAPLESQRTLFSGQGGKPGAWKIFPVLRLNVPAGTVPGTYTATLTFTII